MRRLVPLWGLVALPLLFLGTGCGVWRWFFGGPAALQVQFGEVDRYRLDAPYADVVDAAIRRLAREGVKMADRSDASAVFSASAEGDDKESPATLVLRDRDDLLFVIARTKTEATQEDHNRLARARGAMRGVPGVGAQVDVNGDLMEPAAAAKEADAAASGAAGSGADAPAPVTAPPGEPGAPAPVVPTPGAP